MATVLKIIFLGFIPLTYFAILKNKNKGDPICTQQSVMNIHADSKNTFLTKQRNQNSRVPSTKQGAKQETSIAEQTFFLPAAFTVPSEAHPSCRAVPCLVVQRRGERLPGGSAGPDVAAGCAQEGSAVWPCPPLALQRHCHGYMER